MKLLDFVLISLQCYVCLASAFDPVVDSHKSYLRSNAGENTVAVDEVNKAPASESFGGRQMDEQKFSGMVVVGLPLSDDSHEVIFSIKQKNVDRLEDILYDVSDPSSENYGNHWTREEVWEFTANPAGVNHVKRYLAKHNIAIAQESVNGEYLIASAPINQWENMFATTFHVFEHKQNTETSIARGPRHFLRAKHFTLPMDLVEHVDHVFNVIEFPPAVISGPKPHPNQPQPDSNTNEHIRSMGSTTSAQVTVSLLNSFYKIPSNTGNALTSQALYEALNQTLNPNDLTVFQQSYGLPVQGISGDFGGHVSTTGCNSNKGNDCMEANLDVQYIMGLAQQVPTYYYYWNETDLWLGWILSVSNMADPPDVFSISYASYESDISLSYFLAFNTEAMKLGISGTSIVVASGDDGVSGYRTYFPLLCGYHPYFPATSPYVTTVGGTMGPESGSTEKVCELDLGAYITSGGGFSNYALSPKYQYEAVQGYLNNIDNANSVVRAFNLTGRAYPDVSLLAHSYVIKVNGLSTAVDGTSASTPVFAGMLSLVNADRRAHNLSLVGFVNPFLYSNATKFVNDITSGSNKCTGANNNICCSVGFVATTGWDATTGLGSINFEKFAKALDPYYTATMASTNSASYSSAAGKISMVMTMVGLATLSFFYLH